ncbi:cytochrome P450 [Polyplosphaeria fusca]|uniref:Cytochrome P450 n=1 Tax=Polyplosphaeria fusca TaxID=682080 RepID=A0A9P4UT11_9PLEO|nr:cytochrome P450 [Polyplosphaeria fusca]
MATFQEWGWKEVVWSTVAAYLAYWIAVYVYRVTFHPLAKFPGPKLAAMTFTFWYEFYYEVYPNQLQYLWKIKELHEQYGPIIRINPRHIHINDPDFFDNIYASSPHKRDRCTWYMHTGSKNLSGGMLETIDHDLHKMRRNAVSSFFSKRSIQALEPMVYDTTRRLIKRLKEDGAKGKVIPLNAAWAALAMDTISTYCFGEGVGSIEREQYGQEWVDIIHNGIRIRPFARQFPTLINMLLDLPPSLAAKLNPDIAMMNNFNNDLLTKIEKVMAGADDYENKSGVAGHRTVFHEIRDGNMPEAEKAPKRLMSEGSVFLAAGTETTGRTLSVITYYVFEKPSIRTQLMAELRTVLPTEDTRATLPQLEALPYLTAVINEGLRTAHGVSSRQPHTPTQDDLHYKQ